MSSHLTQEIAVVTEAHDIGGAEQVKGENDYPLTISNTQLYAVGLIVAVVASVITYLTWGSWLLVLLVVLVVAPGLVIAYLSRSGDQPSRS